MNCQDFAKPGVHDLYRVSYNNLFHRPLALSGKLCFNSLWPVTNVTGQGNGLQSRIVREKRGGPGITYKAKNIYIYDFARTSALFRCSQP